VKNLSSKLIQTLFQNVEFYQETDSFGHFVLDTKLMSGIQIPRIIDKNIAIEELKTIKKIFDKFNITFFLTHGTCLGAIREKNFIDYDSDIDIGAYKKDLDKLILALQELKEKYSFKITKLSTSDESIAMIRNNVIIDISLYKLKNDIWQSNKSKIFSIPDNFLNSLIKIEFCGLNINVPNNVEKYLEFQYGKDWKTPITDYYDPYKQKIELPVANFLKYFFGEKLASFLAQKIAHFIKKIRLKLNQIFSISSISSIF
jgi:hypothetical protein